MAAPPVGQPPPGVVQPNPTPPTTQTPQNHNNQPPSWSHILKPQVQKLQIDQRLFRTVVYSQGVAQLNWKTSEVKQSLAKEQLQFAVIGKFSYGRPDLENLRKIIPGQCGIKSECNIGYLDSRYVLIRLSSMEDYVNFLSTPAYWIKFRGRSFPMRSLKWTRHWKPDIETSMALAWISFPNLPPNFFATEFIFSIASAVGTPLKVDTATLNKTRPSCARVKVELDLLAKHPSRVLINEEDDDTGEITSTWVDIMYDHLPLYCKSCRLQGHDENNCKVIHPELWENRNDNEARGSNVNVSKANAVVPAPPLRILTSGKTVGNVNNAGEWQEAGKKKAKNVNDKNTNAGAKAGDKLAMVQAGTNKFAALQEEETQEAGNLGNKAIVQATNKGQASKDQRNSAMQGVQKNAAKDGPAVQKSAGKGNVPLPKSTKDWVKQTWAAKSVGNDGKQLANPQSEQQKQGELVGVIAPQGGPVSAEKPVSAVPVFENTSQQEVPSNSLAIKATEDVEMDGAGLQVADSEDDEDLVDYGEDDETDAGNTENYEEDPTDEYIGLRVLMSRDNSFKSDEFDNAEKATSPKNVVVEKPQGSPEKVLGGPGMSLDVGNASPGLSGGRLSDKELLRAAYYGSRSKNSQLVAKNFEPKPHLAHLVDKLPAQEVDIGEDDELDTESTAQNYVNAAAKADLSPEKVAEHKKKLKQNQRRRDKSVPPPVGGRKSARITLSKTSGRQ